MLVISYCQPEDMAMLIEISEIQKLEDMTLEFLDKININNLDKKLLKQVLFDNITEFDCISSLDSYIDYLNGNKEHKLDTVNLLSQFYSEVTEENLDELISSKRFIEIDNIIPLYNAMEEDYKKFILSTKEYKKYLKKCYELKNSLSKKYLKIFLSELKNLLSEEDYQKVVKDYHLILDTYESNSNTNSENIYLNRYLSPTLIEAFSEKYDQILKTTDDNDQKEFIQTARMLYFKKLGLNLGDKYSVYETSEETKKLIPSKEFVTLLTQKREELYFKMRNEYYHSLSEYQFNRESINQLELLDKDDGYDIYAYENCLTMIVPNIKQIGNQYIMYPLVLVYLGTDDGYLDSYIIHELNHVVETSLQSCDGKNYQIACGWEIFKDVISKAPDLKNYQLLEEEPKREYESFSEIINELISQDIAKIFFELGYYIFDNPDNALYIAGTNYEHTRFFIEEFYQTYKKEIIESRKNGNLQIIFDTVGKENFDALNKLFHTFYQNFPGESFLDVCKDLENNVKNSKTQIYYDLQHEKNKILSNMKLYQKTKKRTLFV